MALQDAQPRHQIAILAVIVGAGVALIAVGDLGGVVLVVFGLVFAALLLPRLCPPRRPRQDEEQAIQDDPAP